SYNYPIQSLASEVTGSAMIDCELAILKEFGLSYLEYQAALIKHEWPSIPLLINEVHDELIFDIPPMELTKERRVVELIVDRMRKVPTLRTICPKFTLDLDVDYFLGETWGIKE
ncbi:MAG: hypothetical protein ACRCZI_01015, partial [Cetobacterium sp.]